MCDHLRQVISKDHANALLTNSHDVMICPPPKNASLQPQKEDENWPDLDWPLEDPDTSPLLT